MITKRIVDCRFFTGYSGHMLTKKDTNQLLQAFTKVFATKQEANKQHVVVLNKLESVQNDVKTVQNTLNNLTEVTGNILSWTDDIHNEIVREKLPQRVHRIEKHLGFPVVAD